MSERRPARERPPEERPSEERLPDGPPGGHGALVFLLAALLFVSPLSGWWSTLSLPWYAMFAAWALVIALAALAVRSGRR